MGETSSAELTFTQEVHLILAFKGTETSKIWKPWKDKAQIRTHILADHGGVEFSPDSLHFTPPKINMTMEKQQFEDASSIKNGYFPASHVSLLEGKDFQPHLHKNAIWNLQKTLKALFLSFFL